MSLIGAVINERYRITGLLGEGRMAIVYRAEQIHLYDRLCAFKVLRPGVEDFDGERRFNREAALLMRLRSQHVVRILDTGALEDGRAYFAMDLLQGQPLSALLVEGEPLELGRALSIFRGILSGLTVAHDEGVIHRDLHPGNAFLVQQGGKEFPVLLDFGLSREAQDRTELTTMGALIGTPTHMAPEQFRYEPVDARVDLYAAGIMLYQMLSGAAPFTALAEVPPEVRPLPSILRVGWQHLCQAPAPLPQLSPKHAQILDRLLAKDPAARPQSARAVLGLLDAPDEDFEDALKTVAEMPALAEPRWDEPRSWIGSVGASSPKLYYLLAALAFTSALGLLAFVLLT